MRTCTKQRTLHAITRRFIRGDDRFGFQEHAGSANSYDLAKAKNIGTVNTNLKCKGIIFDINTLIDSSTSAPSSSSSSSSASSTSLTSSFSQSSSPKSPLPPTSLVDKEPVTIDGVSDIKAKYMEKLQQKLQGAGVSSSHVTTSKSKSKSFIPTENRIAGSDYTMLKNSISYFENKEEAMQGKSRWLIKPGLGDILDSNHSRTVQLVILARKDTKNSLVEQLQGQLDNINFAAVIYSHDYIDASMEQILVGIESQLNLKSLDMLMVSSSDQILEAAKIRSYHTCRYRGADDLFGQIVTEYTATNPLELQDCIEALNGISFRSSVIGSRRYAWYTIIVKLYFITGWHLHIFNHDDVHVVQ